MRIPAEHVSFLQKYYPFTENKQFLVDYFKKDWSQIRSQAAYLGIKRFVKYKRSPEAIEKSRLFHVGRKRSPETCLKISLSMKGKKPWITGKHHSENTKRKISSANKGKISWVKGKKRSEEFRHKISIASKGRRHSWKTKQKLSILNRKERKNLGPHKSDIIKAYQEGYNASTIGALYKVSGSTILRRLKKWGEEIRPTQCRGYLFETNDGHFVRSRAEKLIDDKLFSLGVEHTLEKKIAGKRYKCDWYLPDFNIYIEYWGLCGRKFYDKRKEKKIKLYRDNKLNLLSLYPNKTDKLERKLIPLLTTRKERDIRLTDFL